MTRPQDESEGEADEIADAGAFVQQVSPRAGGEAAANRETDSGGGYNEQQDARLLHGQAATAADAGTVAPDQTRAQDEVGSANSSSSH
ncbi:hypothetical protein GGQ87_002943 [Brevundimonas alba]|uniref:Uncharacterized protein n=1 Tax=Brevundimonas alba TaxID=74314 RepID=A0A7X5YMH0_9CAUL|nr:hypothetical protein [Brevundimonas alba]NJC42648.1 hypothetical protein [Brevundimonas alba]